MKLKELRKRFADKGKESDSHPMEMEYRELIRVRCAHCRVAYQLHNTDHWRTCPVQLTIRTAFTPRQPFPAKDPVEFKKMIEAAVARLAPDAAAVARAHENLPDHYETCTTENGLSCDCGLEDRLRSEFGKANTWETISRTGKATGGAR